MEISQLRTTQIKLSYSNIFNAKNAMHFCALLWSNHFVVTHFALRNLCLPARLFSALLIEAY